MTVNEKIASALAGFAGKVLSSKQIVALTSEAYPDTNIGSILPSDHAGVNSRGVQYARQILQRTGSGYLVLTPDQYVEKPGVSRSRETLAEAAASARALLSK